MIYQMVSTQYHMFYCFRINILLTENRSRGVLQNEQDKIKEAVLALSSVIPE